MSTGYFLPTPRFRIFLIGDCQYPPEKTLFSLDEAMMGVWAYMTVHRRRLGLHGNEPIDIRGDPLSFALGVPALRIVELVDLVLRQLIPFPYQVRVRTETSDDSDYDSDDIVNNMIADVINNVNNIQSEDSDVESEDSHESNWHYCDNDQAEGYVDV